MRASHLTLHEVLLPPSAEWVPDISEWTFARVVQGVGYVRRNDTVREIQGGEVLVTCSSQPVTIRSSQIGEMKLHWFRLCPELLTGFFTLHEQHYLGFLAPKRKAVLQIFAASHDLAAQFATLSKEISRGNSLTARGRMLAIIVSLLRHELLQCEFRPDSPLNAGERFKQLIAAAPAADIQNMSIAELARECGCSERHFSRLFRASFGFSLRARQTELRLQKAQKLLRESDSKLLYVAIESGFRHLGLFNALFKKRFGMTPSEWRKQTALRPMRRLQPTMRPQAEEEHLPVQRVVTES